MTSNNFTADNTNITSIQLNLFDWFDEKPDFHEVLNDKITGYTDLDLENNVVMTSRNHFEFDTRRCPKCGKFALIKKKFVPRKAILDKVGDVLFFLKEYFCKSCHSYPKVKLKNILKDYSKVSVPFLENMYNKARTGIKSLRNTSKDLLVDNATLCHQSVANHLAVEAENELTFDVEELSGYFGYDEQFLEIGDKSYAKAQLVDVVSNQTIAIRIFDKPTYKNVYGFIKDHTPKNKRICLISDHDNTYPAVADNLGFKKQQLCVIHFLKIIDRKVKKIIKENNFTDEEIEELKEYAGKIKYVFLAEILEDFIDRLNHFYKQWDKVPKDLKHFFIKKAVKDMHKLTHHLFDYNIPRTNNQLEGKFSGAQQKSEKSRFKTIKGALSYLKPITERQNEELKRERVVCGKHITDLEKSIIELFEG
jgi:hypothetical protein